MTLQILDSNGDVIVLIDADEKLRLTSIRVGAAGPFAGSGTINGGRYFSIVALNGNEEELPLLKADGDGVRVGGASAASADLNAAGSSVYVTQGRIDLNAGLVVAPWPTSDPVVSGAVWNDGGMLKVSNG